jgi:hypothetical protein
MQTVPAAVPAHRRTINSEPDSRDVGNIESLTPAERVALTIALLNRGLDVMDGFARTSLAGCTRRAFRGQRPPKQEAPLSQS